MKKSLRITLAVAGGLLVAALLFGAGTWVARANGGGAGIQPTSEPPWATGGSQLGYPMMGAGGMMGGYGWTGNSSAKPLTVDEARQAVEGYLAQLNNPDLELKEIMIFSNNAYARVVEKSTGIGAMELLVDPATLSVSPEYGPDRMWNLKYSPMNGTAGTGWPGGMMGRYAGSPASVSADMPVTAQQALQIAQKYLDQQYPGYKTAQDADPFYGYYTIDIMKDGQPAGMLSVNGLSGQVFLHTWHGTFIQMAE